MPRKGSRKVRTGCLTCKARKVKCDEVKPHCNRCTSTGRRCDGYAAPSPPAAAAATAAAAAAAVGNRDERRVGVWHSSNNYNNYNNYYNKPQRPRSLFHGVGNAAESRALQFFCEIAGPFLPGVTDPYFWNQLVMQFSTFEPAVRHSVVAISSLYEQSQSRGARQGVRLRDNELALRHYNAAIAELKTVENQSLVLLVCILFICIEFLQSNRDSAIRHCKHGIYILRNDTSGPAWVREHLVPLFRRLSIFPFFFGTGAEDFPSLVALEDPIPDEFATYPEARAMMDGIFSRTIRLLRCGDDYRFGTLRYVKVSPSLLREQERINYRLQRWRVLFADLDARTGGGSGSGGWLPNTAAMQQFDLGEEYLKSMLRMYLSIAYETCHIWANMAFSARETPYDDYLPSFERLLQQFMLLHTTLPNESRRHRHYPKFIFEMGFMPMTFLVTLKCRSLEVRLAALGLMRLFAVPQENLWQVDITYEVARRVVEMEHGVVLDRRPEGAPQPLSTPRYPGLPPDHVRIRDTRTEHFTQTQFCAADPRSLCGGPGSGGPRVRGRIVNYYMRTPDPDDAIYVHTEIFPMKELDGEMPEWTRGPDPRWRQEQEGSAWQRDLEVRHPPPPWAKRVPSQALPS